MKTVYDQLIPAMWGAWALYWWIASQNVKATKRRESAVSRAGYVALAIGAVVLMFPRLLGGVLSRRFLPFTAASFFIGAFLVAAGLAFAVWARVHLGRNWSGTVTLKQDHELIRSGPYRIVRHPIYTGLLLALAGSVIARGTWSGLFALLIITASLWRKLRLEEEWMSEAFGEDYAKYRAEVPALIPFLL